MRRASIAASMASVLLWPVSAAAIEVVLLPAADTVIYRGETASAAESNALGESLSVGTNNSGITRRSLIRFDLSSVLPGAIVHDARLTLFETRSRGSYDVALHRMTTDWGEGTSNGGNAGASAAATTGDATWLKARHPDVTWMTIGGGGDFVATASAITHVGLAPAQYAWDSAQLAADVRLWIDQPTVNHGWILIGDELTEQNAKLFGSRHSVTPPALTLQITPVPEPGSYALMLCGIGLVGIALRSRRRRSRLASLRTCV